ncbi:MAG: short-chain dehydrogenase, partial [Gemmatimonadetes bacterium]
MKLKDSKILLTGGSLGLGKDAAKVLVESGAQ